MRLQSAIFDMDGTLLDSMGMWRSLGGTLARSHGAEPPPDLDLRVASLGLWEGTAYCKEVCGLPGTVEELVRQVWGQIEHFYQHDVRPKPGVTEFLSLLKMEGVWMYVATATDRPLAEKALRCAGIEHYFRGMITSQEAGQSKREGPEIYERAMRRLQSNKKDTVIFEDAIHAVRTAKAAGFRVAAVYDLSEPDQEEMRALSDYYIESFQEMFQVNEPEKRL